MATVPDNDQKMGKHKRERNRAKKEQALAEDKPISSQRKILPTFLMCFFVGFLGIHRLYVGKTGTAILQIITFGGLGIWALIDLFLLVNKTFTDKEGNKLTQWR